MIDNRKMFLFLFENNMHVGKCHMFKNEKLEKRRMSNVFTDVRNRFISFISSVSLLVVVWFFHGEIVSLVVFTDCGVKERKKDSKRIQPSNVLDTQSTHAEF